MVIENIDELSILNWQGEVKEAAFAQFALHAHATTQVLHNARHNNFYR
jgi:hypothetical protein